MSSAMPRRRMPSMMQMHASGRRPNMKMPFRCLANVAFDGDDVALAREEHVDAAAEILEDRFAELGALLLVVDGLGRELAPDHLVDRERAEAFAVIFFDDGGQHDLFRSEEHTSELQSLMRISYAVFCLKKKTIPRQ